MYVDLIVSVPEFTYLLITEPGGLICIYLFTFLAHLQKKKPIEIKLLGRDVVHISINKLTHTTSQRNACDTILFIL